MNLVLAQMRMKKSMKETLCETLRLIREAGQAGAVIRVEVGQQQGLNALESPAELSDPDLRALAAVDQTAPCAVSDVEAGQRAGVQRHGAAGAQGAEIDHGESFRRSAVSDQ